MTTSAGTFGGPGQTLDQFRPAKKFVTVRRAAIVVACAGVAVVAGYLAFGGGASTDEPVHASAQTSDRASVRKTSFQITTKTSGELVARNQIEIRSKLESQTTIVDLAPEGKSVKTGDLLVKLNSDKIEQDILEQTLQVESARAELVAAENGYNIQLSENESKTRQAASKLTLAKLALEQWEKGDVAKKHLELDLASEKAGRDLKRLEDKVMRSRVLKEQGFLSQNELDLDEIAYVEAVAAVKKATKETEIYDGYKLPQEKETFTSAMIEAQAELDRVRMNNEIELASKEAARTNRRKQLAVREEKLKNLQTQLAAATVVAPSDGLVVYATSLSSGGRGGMGGGNDGPLQIGRSVFPNELIMVLPDTSDMMASVRVQESLSGRIRAGQVATVQVDAAGGKTFAGRVETTSVLAETGGWRDPNLREYTVKVALDQAALEGSGLKPSMRVDAAITLGEVEDVIAVPVQAVFNEGQVRFVYLQQGGKFVKSPVKMGRRSDSFAEIAAGVAVGDIVLLREPTAGEVLTLPWDKSKLELAGYTVDADGRPAVTGGGGRGPGGPEGGGMAPGQRGNRDRAGREGGPREGGPRTAGKPGPGAPADKPVENPKDAAAPKASDTPVTETTAAASETPTTPPPVEAPAATDGTKPATETEKSAHEKTAG